MLETPPHAFTGRHLIDGEWVTSEETFLSPPWKGEGHPVSVAGSDEVNTAARAAEAAFETLYATSGRKRADLLERIAEEIDDRGNQITAIAHAETALPEARLIGERARTCAQLRLFASFIREGRHLETRVEDADPSAVPPRPALRMEMRPIGPVAVFGASNFPLAFSVAGGGDTLAAIGKYGVADGISYISTGGGAFLEFVEGKTLPAVAVLEERAARE